MGSMGGIGKKNCTFYEREKKYTVWELTSSGTTYGNYTWTWIGTTKIIN